MKSFKKIAAASVALALGIGAAADAATVVGATRITIKSALPDFLQVAELLAFDFGGANVALASNGGTATALSQFFNTAPQGGPDEAIDGVFPANYDYAFDPNIPGVYHSGGAGAAEYLTVTFAAPATLASVAIYGRGECCQGRDKYTVTIYGANNETLYTGALDASVSGSASTLFDRPVGGVPEPASWAMMIVGFGAAGAMLRRRTARRVAVG